VFPKTKTFSISETLIKEILKILKICVPKTKTFSISETLIKEILKICKICVPKKSVYFFKYV
jgi:hypothetical protein